MSKQAQFYDLPTEPTPLNRRVYAAAKVPFACMWDLVQSLLGFALGIVFIGMLFFGAGFVAYALLLYIAK